MVRQPLNGNASIHNGKLVKKSHPQGENQPTKSAVSFRGNSGNKGGTCHFLVITVTFVAKFGATGNVSYHASPVLVATPGSNWSKGCRPVYRSHGPLLKCRSHSLRTTAVLHHNSKKFPYEAPLSRDRVGLKSRGWRKRIGGTQAFLTEHRRSYERYHTGGREPPPVSSA